MACKGFCLVKLSRVTEVDKDTLALQDKKASKGGVTVTAKEQQDAVDAIVNKVKETPIQNCPKADAAKTCDCTIFARLWEDHPKDKKVHVPLTKGGNEYDVSCKGKVLFGLGLGYCDEGDDYFASAIGLIPGLHLTLSLDTSEGEAIPGEAVAAVEKSLEKKGGKA